jgi:hypothetical protein
MRLSEDRIKRGLLHADQEVRSEKLPPFGPGLLPHPGHRLTGGDVQAGQRVRNFGQGERLGHDLAATAKREANAPRNASPVAFFCLVPRAVFGCPRTG